MQLNNTQKTGAIAAVYKFNSKNYQYLVNEKHQPCYCQLQEVKDVTGSVIPNIRLYKCNTLPNLLFCSKKIALASVLTAQYW